MEYTARWIDGVLRCFADGIEDAGYTGLATTQKGNTVYFENGLFQNSLTGVAQISGAYYYVRAGIVDTDSRREAHGGGSDSFEASIASALAGLTSHVDEIAALTKRNSQSIYNIQHPFFDMLRCFTYLESDSFTPSQKKWYLNKSAFAKLQYWQNIDNPKTFNEKTNWYKLHYNDPLITQCIDKHLFKDYVRDTIGAQYVVPTYAVWEDVDDIDYEPLPDQFVLKSNWGSGSRHVIIVKHKNDGFNGDLAKLNMARWMLPWENVYWHTLDWGYKDIEPKIIAEEYIADRGYEYCFFCFDGEPKFLWVARDSSPGEQNYRNVYDAEWNLLPVKRNADNFPEPLLRPETFDEMLDISRKLAAPFPHTRVDILETSDGLKVQELTFYTGSGFQPWQPAEYDAIFGEYFNLPEANM